jgi:hypothetical protein
VSRGVEITVRHERLSQGTRGAFLLHAADGDPHQVTIVGPTLFGGKLPAEGHRISFDDLIVDLQPGRDLVVPFDVKTGEIPRGNYELRADVSVDGFPAEGFVHTELRVR